MSRHVSVRASRLARPPRRTGRVLAVEQLESRRLLAAAPIISEFLASNDNGLRDFDNDASDWIEVQNVGDASLDLAGWYLTDDATALTKWKFPVSQVLAPQGRTLVFASSKDFVAPSGELHANFSLSAQGEYLALVEPDGVTVRWQTSPSYPTQFSDVSYGVAMITDTTELIGPQAPGKVRVPTSGADDSSWTAADFNDGAWSPAVTGVGYVTQWPISAVPGFSARLIATGNTGADREIGSASEAQSIINGTKTNIQIVKDFRTTAAQIDFAGDGGTFSVNNPYPDGSRNGGGDGEDFIVWAGATLTIPVGQWTIGFASDDGGKLSLPGATFQSRTNTNGTQPSGTLLYEATRSPSWTTGTFTVSGSPLTTTLDAFFFERGGGDLFEIAIRSGQSAGTPSPADGWVLLSNGSLGWGVQTTSSLAIPPFESLIETDLKAQLYQQATSAYLRIPFEVVDPAVFDILTLRMQYDDAFVAYLNGTEVARSNVIGTAVWNSTAGADRADSNVLEFQEIDLTSFRYLLQAGENVLAVHGLNYSSSPLDTGLLVAPQLVGVRILSTQLSYMQTPTPSAANSEGSLDVMAPPEFSVSGETFATNFSLVISSDDPAAVIRYTLDGSRPTESSPIYAAPLNISTTVQVRAQAFRADRVPSQIVSQMYLKMAADVQAFTSNLPIIVIDNFGRGRPPTDPKQPAYVAVFEPDGGRTAIAGDPTVTSRIGIEVRGSSTAGQSKANYSFEFWDELDGDLDLALLGMPEEADWVLYAPYDFDRALIRNAFIYDLSNQIGDYAVRTRFVEVYANTNDGTLSQSDYVGVYVLMEKIKRDDERVDIQKLSPQYATSPLINGGYILKIDRADPGDVGFSAGGQSLRYVEPKEQEINPAQAAYIRQYINDFRAALDGPNFADPVNGYAKYIDVDAWIDHHILNVLAMNVDALRLSTYMFKARDGKLTMGPIWDFDRSMDSYDGRDDNPATWKGTGDATDYFNYPWWNRLFQDPNFWQKWIDRWQELRGNQFSAANINATIDGMAAQLTEAQARNFQRWPLSLQGGYQGEINHMKTWLAQRAAWIDSNFVAPPAFDRQAGHVPPGRQLAISGNGNGFYYTLDGSDPRLSGGGIRPGTVFVPVSTTLTLNDTTRVIARAYRTGSWSGPIDATFVTTGPLALRVSEVMYHPSDPPVGGPYTDNDFEFIELTNVGMSTLDLAGVQFTAGIAFTFDGIRAATLAPGEHVLLVANEAAFETRYGSGFNIAGQYTGRLDNSGEQLLLVDTLGESILDFTFDDAWRPHTDGEGKSLVIVDPAGDAAAWNMASGWRESTRFGGSPGSADPALLRGDLNGDGAVGNLDIAPFALAISDPTSFRAQHPALDADALGDINQDGAFNNLDIGPFASLIVGPQAAGVLVSAVDARVDSAMASGAIGFRSAALRAAPASTTDFATGNESARLAPRRQASPPLPPPEAVDRYFSGLADFGLPRGRDRDIAEREFSLRLQKPLYPRAAEARGR